MKIPLPMFTAAALAFVQAPAAAQPTGAVPGYTYGQKSLAKAPFTLVDVAALKRTLLLTEDDVRASRQSKAVLADQTDAVLDVWYGFVASAPELLYYFGDAKTGKPDGAAEDSDATSPIAT